MELRQLQYAIQIAMEKNFSRAAEKLHIAQPSLSQQLSKLEKEIGLLLFQRNTNSVEITHAGAVFVEKAQKILDGVAQLKKEMEDISQMRKGRLTVGSLPITGSHVLPSALPAFQQKYPEIEIILIEETSSVLESLAISGQTDICLLTLPLMEMSLEYHPLIEEEICIALPPHHPLAGMSGGDSTADLRDFKDEAFILLKKGQGFRQITMDLCVEAGFTPRIVFESTNIETVQSLVASGMGVAFVPSMVLRKPGVPYSPAYVKLKGHPHRTIVIAYRKGRYLSKAAVAFIETLREEMGRDHKVIPKY